MAVVTRLLRGEPLELVARETNVTIQRLIEWRDRALTGAASATDCTRRSENPSMKQPRRLVAPEQKSGI